MKGLIGTQCIHPWLPFLGGAVCIRGGHTATGGRTGSGKSWLATHMIIEAARGGAGTVVIDPHESLLKNLLRAGAHVLEKRGVRFLWPGGPLPFIEPWNPLANAGGDAAERVADQFLGACARIWGLSSDSTARTWRLLKYSAWSLAAAGWTPLEVGPFLTNPAFRDYIIKRAAQPKITAWAERTFSEKTPAQLDDLISPSENRLAMLATNRELQLLVGLGVLDPTYQSAYQHATGKVAALHSDLAQAINAGTHVFVALPDDVLGEDQELFAALIFDYVLGTIMRRKKDTPGVQTELFLDEFPAYVSTAFGKLLAQARGFRAWAHLFCQGLHQAPVWLQEEIGTNCDRFVGPTKNVHEAADAAALFVEYDAEERSKKDYWTAQVKKLPDRIFIAKIGSKPAIRMRTPTVRLRHSLEHGLELVTARSRGLEVSRDDALAELQWRERWIAAGGYGTDTKIDAPVAPLFLDDVEAGEIEVGLTWDLRESHVGRGASSGRPGSRGRR